MWRFILLGILLALVYFAITRALRRLRSKEKTIEKPVGPAGLPSEMMQDPICGVFVPKEGAVCLQHDEQTVFFCSDACRADYQNKIGSR